MRWVLYAALMVVVSLVGCAPMGTKDHGNHPAIATPAHPGTLRVSGPGLQSVTLTLADLKAMPRKTVKVQEKDGAEVTYEGVTAQEILMRVGMQFGHSLRGTRLRDYLLAEGSDGYGVVYALTEVSDEFSGRVVLVADKANGAPISKEDGPLRMIVSDEVKRARWVRDVVSLTIQGPPAK